MRSEALFLNGIYEDVLQEMLKIQSVLPEQILFLQPYSGSAMAKLRDDPPTIDLPMRLFASTTTDLATVSYTAEIVGWDYKRALPYEKRHALNRIIYCLQPGEGGVYDSSPSGDGTSANLLHVRRLQRLAIPFPVNKLIKTSDGKPVSAGRTTAGGWAYVRSEPA